MSTFEIDAALQAINDVSNAHHLAQIIRALDCSIEASELVEGVLDHLNAESSNVELVHTLETLVAFGIAAGRLLADMPEQAIPTCCGEA